MRLRTTMALVASTTTLAALGAAPARPPTAPTGSPAPAPVTPMSS